MTNKQLEQKVEKFLEIENYFDFIEAVYGFEKEYKNSDFYKKTKMPLLSIIKEARWFYGLNVNKVFAKIQTLIDKLDLSHLMDLIEKIGTTYETENEQIMNLMSSMKDIFQPETTTATAEEK